MEVIFQRNYIGYPEVKNAVVVGKLETITHQDGNEFAIDLDADLYKQGMVLARQLGGLELNEASYRKSVSFNDIEKEISHTKLVSKISSDSYKALKREKRSVSDTVIDGRPHIKGLETMIVNIHDNYQKQYGELIKASTQFMQDINTAIGKLSNHMKAGSDGKIEFYAKSFILDLNSAAAKYSGRPFTGNPNDANHLDGHFNSFSLDESQATPLLELPLENGVFEFWEKKLSGQGFIVKKTGTHVKIYPDLKPIAEIFNTVRGLNGWADGAQVQSQQFQSMQTAIDSQKNAVNNSVSRLLETFRQDNSHFETLTQLLIQLVRDLNQNNSALVNF
ncbi:IpaD/SipD/SspD family type III secretion system needle tip protein [Providencia sp. SP181]|uniref:IpaD/SipD/SspD family type III secretion system needle tip protein n=1 Tax=Providencia sp. SP181 TaxID=3136277 RepID=UPI003D291D54